MACGIFLEQGLSPCLLHRQAVPYSLDHQEVLCVSFRPTAKTIIYSSPYRLVLCRRWTLSINLAQAPSYCENLSNCPNHCLVLRGCKYLRVSQGPQDLSVSWRGGLQSAPRCRLIRSQILRQQPGTYAVKHTALPGRNWEVSVIACSFCTESLWYSCGTCSQTHYLLLWLSSLSPTGCQK